MCLIWLLKIRITSWVSGKNIECEDVLKKVIAKRFIATFKTATQIDSFDVDMYFKLTEKITVFDGKLVVCLLDGSDVECEI